MVDPNRWTLKTQEALAAALDLARQRSHPEVTPHHILAALLGQDEGVVVPTLERAGVGAGPLRKRLEELLGGLPKAYGGAEPQLGRAARAVLAAADTERSGLHDEYLSTEHLLLALAGTGDTAAPWGGVR